MKSGFYQIDSLNEDLIRDGRLTLIQCVEKEITLDMMETLLLNSSLIDLVHGSDTLVDFFTFDKNYSLEDEILKRIGDRRIRSTFGVNEIYDLKDTRNPLVIYGMDLFDENGIETIRRMKKESDMKNLPIIFFNHSGETLDLTIKRQDRERLSVYRLFNTIIDMERKNDGFQSGTIRSVVLNEYIDDSKIKMSHTLSYDSKTRTFRNVSSSSMILSDVIEETREAISTIENASLKTLLLDIFEDMKSLEQKSFLMTSERLLDYSFDLANGSESRELRELSLRILLIGLLIKDEDAKTASVRRMFLKSLSNIFSIFIEKKGQTSPYAGFGINLSFFKNILFLYRDEFLESIVYLLYISLKIENKEKGDVLPLIKEYKEWVSRHKNYRNHSISHILNSIAVSLFFKNDSASALYFWNEALRHNENDVDASYNLYLFYKQGYSFGESRENERKYYERYMRAVAMS